MAPAGTCRISLQNGPAPADSPFLYALCRGATQTSFVVNLLEAFWMFSNFRDKMDRKDASAMERCVLER